MESLRTYTKCGTPVMALEMKPPSYSYGGYYGGGYSINKQVNSTRKQLSPWISQNGKTELKLIWCFLDSPTHLFVVVRFYSSCLSSWNWCGIALITEPSKCVNRSRVCRARQSGQNGIKPTTFSFNWMPGRGNNSDWIEVKWTVLNWTKFNTLKHWMIYHFEHWIRQGVT